MYLANLVSVSATGLPTVPCSIYHQALTHQIPTPTIVDASRNAMFFTEHKWLEISTMASRSCKGAPETDGFLL